MSISFGEHVKINTYEDVGERLSEPLWSGCNIQRHGPKWLFHNLPWDRVGESQMISSRMHGAATVHAVMPGNGDVYLVAKMVTKRFLL